MPHGTVTYGKETIQYTVLHVARKTLAIEVLPDAKVVIKAPLESTQEEVRRRVLKRARWIIKQQQYFRQFDPRTPERQFIGGETHLYLGKQYRLKVCVAGQDKVLLSRGYFVVETKAEYGPEETKSLMSGWYAEKAASTFHNRFNYCWLNFENMKLTMPRLQVRRMKKRWGSLSRGGILTLNTDLIRAPRECIDYVITHELCHLKYHDHSPEFYRLLEKVMPDWEKRKHKLELALV